MQHAVGRWREAPPAPIPGSRLPRRAIDHDRLNAQAGSGKVACEIAGAILPAR
jgi:hypothetical protein